MAAGGCTLAFVRLIANGSMSRSETTPPNSVGRLSSLAAIHAPTVAVELRDCYLGAPPMLGDIALLCDSCLRANVQLTDCESAPPSSDRPSVTGSRLPTASSSDASHNELSAQGSYGSPARDFTDVWPG